jgi:hypothetical protein
MNENLELLHYVNTNSKISFPVFVNVFHLNSYSSQLIKLRYFLYIVLSLPTINNLFKYLKNNYNFTDYYRKQTYTYSKHMTHVYILAES